MHPLENLVTNSCVLFFISFAAWLFLILLPRLLLRIVVCLVVLLMGNVGDEEEAVLAVTGYPANYTQTRTTVFSLPI